MKRYISWDEYMKMCGQLVHQLKGTKITDIIGVSRGGLIPAQCIAYQHGVGRVHNFGIRTYSKNDERLSDSNISFYQIPTINFNETHSILITDDIADSGRTLKIIMDHLKSVASNTTVYTATLHYKPKTSIIRPTYFSEEILGDEWIVYPYDID